MMPSRMASRKVSAKPGSRRHSLFCLRDSFSKSHCFTWTFPGAEFAEGPRDGKWVRASFPVKLKGNKRSSELWKTTVMEEKRRPEGRIFRKLLLRALDQLGRLIRFLSHLHHTPRQSSRPALRREERVLSPATSGGTYSCLQAEDVFTPLHFCFLHGSLTITYRDLFYSKGLQVTVCHSSLLSPQSINHLPGGCVRWACAARHRQERPIGRPYQ